MRITLRGEIMMEDNSLHECFENITDKQISTVVGEALSKLVSEKLICSVKKKKVEEEFIKLTLKIESKAFVGKPIIPR